MKMKTELIEKIVKHPAVSRCMAGKEQTDGLRRLVTLRRARANVKQSARNFKEEIEHGLKSYDEGGQVEVPNMPGNRLLTEALEAGGLPADLESMIRGYLGN